jgi:hypothetical protein
MFLIAAPAGRALIECVACTLLGVAAKQGA